MPKIVPHNNHTKTKEKVRNDNIILVKTAVPEDHHNGFQAYGPDGSIGKGKLGAHGIHEFQVDPVVEAKKKKKAEKKEAKLKKQTADEQGNKFVQTFDENSKKGLRTIQVGAKRKDADFDVDKEGDRIVGQAAALAAKHAADEEARVEAHRDAKARKEADALAEKKRITFRRSMNMRHGEVKWKRMTAIVGRRGDVDDETEAKLVLHFKAVARGKSKLTRKDIATFFEKLNGVKPPFDALEYLRADTEGMTRANMREKIDDYNTYMKRRKDDRARQQQFIAQFERFYKGDDEGAARRYNERDVYEMVAYLCGEDHPNEWAMIYAFRDVGGYELDCVQHRHLHVNDAAKFLTAYTERRDFQRRDAAKKRGPVGHVLYCILGVLGLTKSRAKYIL